MKYTTPFSQITLPDLPYSYDALEPIISKEIMELHHKKHHAAYVTNFNKAVEKYEEAGQKEDLEAQIALFKAMKFNGGGHINHSLFWENLAPTAAGGGVPIETGKLYKAIVQLFGSFEHWKEIFSEKAVAIQGSGWIWLGFNTQKQQLEIACCDNQDPLSTQGLIPILGIDVWEHAYYLQYKNVRAEYVKSIWSVIHWKTAESRFEKAMEKR